MKYEKVKKLLGFSSTIRTIIGFPDKNTKFINRSRTNFLYRFAAIFLFVFCMMSFTITLHAYDSWWDPAGANGWGISPDWHCRFQITLSKFSGQDTINYSNNVIQTDIDFLSLGYDNIDDSSPRIVRWTGFSWDTIPLNVFNWVDQGGIAGYDKCTIRFKVHQNDLFDSSSLSVKYYVYFDTGSGKLSPNYAVINYPYISDSFEDTSQISFQSNVILDSGKIEVSSVINTWTQTSQSDFSAALETNNINTSAVPGSVKLDPTAYSVGGFSGWLFRRKITITEPGVTKRINAPCKILLSFPEGKLNNAFQEIRVTDTAGIVVADTVTGYTVIGGSVVSCTLVFLVDIDTSVSRDYYLYYGNSSANTPDYPVFKSNTGGTVYSSDGDSAGSSNVATPYYSRINFSSGIEAYTTTDNLGVGDDNATFLSLPWSIKFFGNDMSGFYVSSNGLLTCSTNSDYTNTSGEFQGSYGGMIAPFWDDLYPGGIITPGVFQNVYSNPDRCVWTWRERHYNNTRSRYIFQLVIYKIGDIAFRYQQLSGIITSGASGVGDAPGVRTVGISKGNNLNWLRNDDFSAGNPTTTPCAFYQCADAFTTAIGDEEVPPAPYKTDGYFISSKYDAGSKVIWKNISWSAYTSGSGTSVKFQTRTANSISELDTSPWSNTYSASPSFIASSDGRWVQYRAILQTSVPDSINFNSSPMLDDVNISFQKYEAAAQIISTITIESPPIFSVTPVWGETVPVSAGLNVFFSNDGGISYSAVSNGSQYIFGSQDNKLKYKIEFTSPGNTTPIFYGLYASYKVQQPDISMGSIEKAVPYAITYSDTLYSKQRSAFSQGESVYSKSFVLFTAASDSNIWAAPATEIKQSRYVTSDASAIIFDSYTFSPDAAAGTWTLVGKTTAGNTIVSCIFTCQNKAKVVCFGQSTMPPIVNQGQANIRAQILNFNNDVPVPGAAALLDTFILTVKDADGFDIPADSLLSAISIKKNGNVLQQVSSPTGSSVLVDFSGSPQYIPAGETLSIEIFLNFKPDAILGVALKTQITDTDSISVKDINSGTTVPVYVLPPLASNTAVIQQGPSVTTYFDAGCAQVQDIFSQGQIVYAKIIHLDTASVFNCKWTNPIFLTEETHVLISDGAGTLVDSYVLASFAETGSWALGITTPENTAVCSTDFTTQYKASLFCSSLSNMPPIVQSPSDEFKAQTIHFYNNTPVPAANLKIETFALSFVDENNDLLDIGGIIDKIKIMDGATQMQTCAFPAGNSVIINFGGSPRTINSGETFSCDIFLQMSSDVPGGLIFRTRISDSYVITAKDNNSLYAFYASALSWPLLSDSATVQAGILNTYRDSSRSVQQTNFSQGQFVYSKITGLTNGKQFTIKWVSPYGTIKKSASFVSDGSGEITTDSYALLSNAETGAWVINIYSMITGELIGNVVFNCQYKPFLQCSVLNAMPENVSAGQQNVKSQTLILQNTVSVPGASAQLNSFTLSFFDSTNTPQEMSGFVSKVMVKKGAVVIKTFDLPSGNQLNVNIDSGETIGQGSSVNYDIYLDFSQSATPGLTVKTSLVDTGRIHAKDMNCQDPVSVSGTFPLSSNAAAIQSKAVLFSASANYMPSTVTQGETEIKTQIITFTNSASLLGAGLKIVSFKLSFCNSGGSPQDISILIKKIQLKFSGNPIQILNYPSGDSFVLDFGGSPQYVTAGCLKNYEIWLDFYDTATIGSVLKTQIDTAISINAQDINSGETIVSLAGSWPLTSSTVTIQSRPTMINTAQDFMPDTVSQGQYSVRSQRFFFANSSPLGGASINYYSFILSFRDANNNDTSVTGILDSIEIKNGTGTVLQTIISPSGTNVTVDFNGLPQMIDQGDTLVIDVFLNFSATAPNSATLKTLIKDTYSFDARGANTGNTVANTVYPCWSLCSSTTTIKVSAATVRTYRDADRINEQTEFGLAQTIYSKAWGLSPNTDYNSVWKNPSNATKKTTTIKTNSQGTLIDSYLSSDAYGYWKTVLVTTSGSTVCTQVFRVKNSSLKIITSAQIIKAGTISSIIKMAVYDPNGDTDTTFNNTVALITSSNTGLFSISNTTWKDTSLITFQNGCGFFYYKDYYVGSPIITVSNTLLSSDSQVEKVLIKCLKYINFPFVISSVSSAACMVQAQDGLGNTATNFSDTAVLSASSVKGSFSISNTIWQNITIVQFNSGRTFFYYKDKKGGNPIISITRIDSWTFSDTQQETITKPVIVASKTQYNFRNNDSGTVPIVMTKNDTIEYIICVKNIGTETATGNILMDTYVFDTSVNNAIEFVWMDTSTTDTQEYTTSPVFSSWILGAPPAGSADVKGLRWKISNLGINEERAVRYRISVK